MNAQAAAAFAGTGRSERKQLSKKKGKARSTLSKRAKAKAGAFDNDLLTSSGPSRITSADVTDVEDDDDGFVPQTEPSVGSVVVKYTDVLKRQTMWCHFCTDPISPPYFRICSSCGALICVARIAGGLGCIAADSIKEVAQFDCHECLKHAKEPVMVPYRLAGQGMLGPAKLTWPLLFVPMKLVNLDSPALDLTTVACRAEYLQTPEHLKIYEITMSGRPQALDTQSAAVEFIRRHLSPTELSEKKPPNLIVVLDTHSDSYSGQLQTTKTTGQYQKAPEILFSWVGLPVFQQMQAASDLARGWPEKVELEEKKSPRADLTPRTRGGWRVLILLACGAAVTVDDSWNRMKSLVDDGTLDLLVAFSGFEMMPLSVDSFTRALVQAISTTGVDDLWEVVKRVLVRNTMCVAKNTLVAAFRNDEGKAVVWEASESSPDRPFGLTFTLCAGKSCPARGQRSHIRGFIRHLPGGSLRGRIRCLACRWTSQWVKFDDLKDLVFQVDQYHAPSLYYHEYPLHPKITRLFATSAKEESKGPGGSGSRMDVD